MARQCIARGAPGFGGLKPALRRKLFLPLIPAKAAPDQVRGIYKGRHGSRGFTGMSGEMMQAVRCRVH